MKIEKKKDIVIEGLVNQIKSIIDTSRRKIAKDVNIELLITYWKIGKLIVEREELNNIDHKSSRDLILELSKQLTQEFGKGFSISNLFNMRKFGLTYPNVQTLSGQISWSHYCELLIISEEDKRSFYEKEV